ncbi:MAG: hypothetical protein JEZ02_14140 [Desulfatibacillum sp.]|nr:hypothetical protein [Desulfatibacillum sp.]
MDEGDKPITTAELQELRHGMLAATDRAITRNTALYCQIRRMLCSITHGDVEIGDYYILATRLARLLETMGPGTLFSEYYPENIHPEKRGKAQFFRAECQDLLFQLDALQEWRKKARPLKLIHGGKANQEETAPFIRRHNA